jgi:hypothetical protein
VSKIKVTNLDTGEVKEYDYSYNNWARRPACMQGDKVVMWCPRMLAHGLVVSTTGRRWEII